MLIRQGEIAFERWTGIPDTAEIMRAALETWAGDPSAGA
jgi:shikimate 5-dehydrogenase